MTGNSEQAQNQDSDWSEEPLPGPSTLGGMIDGFRRMSNEDRSIFLSTLGLMGYSIPGQERSAPPAAPAGSFARVASRPTAPANFAGVQFSTATPIVESSSSSAPRGQTSSDVFVLGTTKDPKTGKVYKLQPKRERTQEFVTLFNRAEEARRVLGQYMTNHGYYHDVAAGVTRRRTDQSDVVDDSRLTHLVEVLRAAQEAVTGYKRLHPEEFRGTLAKPKKSAIPTRNLPGKGKGPDVGQKDPPSDGGPSGSGGLGQSIPA